MISFEDQDVLSAPLSPNRVQEGHSQDMPAEGSIFDVSPDLPGFSMWPAITRYHTGSAIDLRQFQ